MPCVPLCVPLTARVCFQAVNRLHLPLILTVAVMCGADAFAGLARFTGFPTRKLIYVRVPAPPPESAVKLPPPGPPSNLPQHVDTEKHTTAGEVTVDARPAVDPAHEQKARIKAERERLNRNALNWQQERAAAGSSTAQRSMGMRYLTGDGVEKDEARGMDLLRKGAAGGDSAAQKELAKREPAKKE